MSILVVVALTSALYQTLDMSFRGRLFPQAIIVPTLILASVHLALLVRNMLLPARRPEQDQPTEGAEDTIPPDLEWQRTLRLFWWLAFWMLSIWLIGFIPAVAIGIFLYVLLEARRPWWQCILMGIGAWVFLYLLLDRLMHQLLPSGEMFRWLGE
jgi:hypothetical protein